VCGICDITNSEPFDLFTEEEINRIIAGIYIGKINPYQLDLYLYKQIAEKLTSGVYEGFGLNISSVNYNTPDYNMLDALRKNVYKFSAAKQYQQVRQMNDYITNGDKIRSFSEFKKEAFNIFEEFNKNHLKTEYNSAISQSRSASLWMEIENNKELLPMLEYHTVGDGRVRPEHAMLNGIKRPIGDKFWDNYFPPNGWNCRCTTLQTDDTDKTDLKGFKRPDTVPLEFMMNAGKQKVAFSPKHPYFDVPKKDENLKHNNFNLPLPS
jgi:SPP1 gp7 family putative phage head morphogenesis protein